LPKELHKGFYSLFILIVWSTWLEYEMAMFFVRESKQIQRLIVDIRDEAKKWVGVGFSALSVQLQ
jgi:hypothetical protein